MAGVRSDQRGGLFLIEVEDEGSEEGPFLIWFDSVDGWCVLFRN